MDGSEWCRVCKHHKTFHFGGRCSGNSMDDPDMDYWGYQPSCPCPNFQPDDNEGYTP